jgi:DNA topoisomerase IB
MREVAGQLGNTPAVARASYVDPRVVDLFDDGVTVNVPPPSPGEDDRRRREDAEKAVLKLLVAEVD